FLTAQLTAAKTQAERTAAVAALSRVAHPRAAAAVLDALDKLPLDEASAIESAYARAALRLDAAGAERTLLARLDRSMRARQSLDAEVEALGRVRSKASLPLLLAAAGRPAAPHGDRSR